MIQIRQNVFETNSSSTHSLVLCDDKEFKEWSKGNLYYCNGFPYNADKSLRKADGDFYTEEEAKAICKSADIDWDDWERQYHFQTYDEFCDDEYLEVDEYSYTTKGGEKIHATAKYGYSG